MKQMVVLEEVIKIRERLPGIGTDKLHHLLTENQIKLGRNKRYDLLRDHHLLCHKKRKRVRTTNSQHPFYKYPNLTKELMVIRPNQLWVSDITYIRTGNDFSYLSLITDAYSHKIVGWAVGETLHTKGPLAALNMATKTLEKGKESLIHHSDRGLQYCSRDYIQLLSLHTIQISMTSQGDPGENAIAERINRTIKEEFNCRAFFTFEQTKTAIAKSIQAYNNLRPHASCDYLTPNLAHQQHGLLRKRWRKQDRKKTMNKVNFEDKVNGTFAV
ncbi:MAG: family transposase [Adhaeribacter sp.]|nr:family transposase [Adhaeribacter sp.]